MLRKKLLLATNLLIVSTSVFAASYPIPPMSESLIGQLQYYTTDQTDTVLSLQKHYDVGYNAMELANPHLDTSKEFPADALVTIPTEHLLPNQAREGIVVNLPEMRMYYFVAGSHEVRTYPIGIGKIGKTIPIVKTAITRKKENPVWIPPADIREFQLKQGVVLPSIMPAGPDNPLGPYAIYMSVPTYLIHSTIFPESVGKRASFGCLRMYESDIKDFFPSIQGGIPVAIINTPVKVGWQDQSLYMEAYPPLEEHGHEYATSLPGIVHIISQTTQHTPTLVDWQLITYINEARDAIPHEIGIKIG
jgi:L,D-transpeptidase ErfK/SrfK